MNKELAEAVKLFISQPLNFPLSRGQIMEVARIALPTLEQQELGEGDWIVLDGTVKNMPKHNHRIEVKYANGTTAKGKSQRFYWGIDCESRIVSFRNIPERATNQNGEQ